MKRSEWMNELERNLMTLDDNERETAMSYYAELFNDKRDSGMRESEILAGFGDPREVARWIISDSVNAEHRSAYSRRDNTARASVIDDDYFSPPPRRATAAVDNDYEPPAPPLKKRKRHIFTHIILPVIGAIIGVGLLFSLIVTIIDVSTKEDKFYEGNVELVELLLDIGSSNVEVRKGDKFTVTYTTSAIRQIDVREDGAKLRIDDDQSLFWSWAQYDAKMVVTVPEACNKMDLLLSAGRIEATSINCAEINVQVSAGEVVLSDCSSALSEIKVSAGEARVENSSTDQLAIDVSAGSLNLDNVSANTVHAKVSAGDFRLNRLDVQTSLFADVSAGSVKGSLIGKEDDFSVTVDVSAGSCNLKNAYREVSKTLNIDVSAGSVDLNFVE